MFEFPPSSDGGVACRCLFNSSLALRPVNGGLPVNSSWIVHARL